MSLGLSMRNTRPSANRDNFISSFPIWMPFICFSCLIALARPFITMLNKSWENGYPCLVPDFRRKAFSFLPLNMMWICHIWSLLCWGMGFWGGSVVKNPPTKAGDPGDESSISLALGRAHGGGIGNWLHYSCLENPMDRGAWQTVVHGVAESWTCPHAEVHSLYARFVWRKNYWTWILLDALSVTVEMLT